MIINKPIKVTWDIIYDDDNNIILDGTKSPKINFKTWEFVLKQANKLQILYKKPSLIKNFYVTD